MPSICICFLGSPVKINVFVTSIITAHGFITVNNTGIGGVLTVCLRGGSCQTGFLCFARAEGWFSNTVNSQLVAPRLIGGWQHIRLMEYASHQNDRDIVSHCTEMLLAGEPLHQRQYLQLSREHLNLHIILNNTLGNMCVIHDQQCFADQGLLQTG